MSKFKKIFPNTAKPLIAMAHVPPLPGTPLYDEKKGVQGLIDHVQRDTELLLKAGFDAILFCNEGDRPYQLNAGLEAAAVMSRVVTECKPSDIPFGVDFLWDANLLNTGAKAKTIEKFFKYADGCIVGSDLKRDGYTWNEVDPERAKRFIEAARSA